MTVLEEIKTAPEVPLNLCFLLAKEININHHYDNTIIGIQKAVCNYYNIDLQKLHANTRKREYVLPRQIAMYFCKKLTKLSFREIGENIGNKDHATVIFAIKTIKNLIETNRQFRNQINELEKLIQ